MKRVSICISCLVLPIILGAQQSFFTKLQSFPPQKVVLISNWDSLTTLKDDSAWDGKLSVTCGDTTTEWECDLMARGKFRRNKCVFPPLELNLKKGQLRKEHMLEFDKIKIVTHCEAENADPADLDEELLIYQLYNLLTPYSFHAIALKIDYVDPKGRSYRKGAPALILEPTAELAHRMDAQELEVFSAPEDSLDASSYCRVALFEFMIGNFDWNHATQQNVKMIGGTGKYHLVPYDFDFSAIVIPVYARLPSQFGLKDFRDRIYLGQYFNSALPGAVTEFLGHREKLLAHVNAYEALSKSRRKEIVEYLDDFFVFLEKEGHTLKKGTILLNE